MNHDSSFYHFLVPQKSGNLACQSIYLEIVVLRIKCVHVSGTDQNIGIFIPETTQQQ